MRKLMVIIAVVGIFALSACGGYNHIDRMISTMPAVDAVPVAYAQTEITLPSLNVTDGEYEHVVRKAQLTTALWIENENGSDDVLMPQHHPFTIIDAFELNGFTFDRLEWVKISTAVDGGEWHTSAPVICEEQLSDILQLLSGVELTPTRRNSEMFTDLPKEGNGFFICCRGILTKLLQK